MVRSHLDRVDIRILRELSQSHTVWPARPGLIASYRQIARALGISPGTVRNRVGQLIRSGFLQGVSVYANPNVLGLLGGSYAIQVSPAMKKTQVIDRLARVDGVVFFENLRGSLLGIGFTYHDADDLEEKLSQIDRLAHSTRGMFSRVMHPPCSVSLTPPEWALVSRLMAGSFRTYSHLAGDLGVSVRTLKRRLAKLDRSGAVLTFPKMDLRAIAGGVAADLLVSYHDEPTKSEAQAKVRLLVDDWMIFAGPWEDFESYRLILPNVSRATELAEAVGQLPGVAHAQLELVDGLVDNFERLRHYVDRHVMAGRRPAPVEGRPAPSVRSH
jgi:DNA-binding Lrp family transcriptional regulator